MDSYVDSAFSFQAFFRASVPTEFPAGSLNWHGPAQDCILYTFIAFMCIMLEGIMLCSHHATIFTLWNHIVVDGEYGERR